MRATNDSRANQRDGDGRGGERHCLDRQLRRQPRARRAEKQARRQLDAALTKLRQPHGAHIADRKEQHDTGQCDGNPQPWAKPPDDDVRVRGHGDGHAVIRLVIPLAKRTGDAREFRAHLGVGRRGPAAAECLEDPDLPLLIERHGLERLRERALQRQPDVRIVRIAEAARHHAHDPVVGAVDEERLPDDSGRPAEAVHPDPVTENHRRQRRALKLRHIEVTSRRRPNAERPEKR